MNTDKRNPAEPQGFAGSEDHEVPEDDAVIGVAVRRSLGIILVLGLVAITVWWLSGRSPPTAAVEDRELVAPVSGSAVSVDALPSIPFRDATRTAGLTFNHENGATGDRLLPETMGGGVAFLDFDNDGYVDLFFVNSNRWPWSDEKQETGMSALYRNKGDGTFEDITGGSGLDVPLYGMGVATADYDGDGNVDLFVTAVGENRLYRNIGGGRFVDETVTAGVAGDANRWSSSAAFFDFDRDGDLDLFVANYVDWSRELDFEVDYRLAGVGRAYGPPTNFPGTDGYLYRNDGNGRFTDVSEEAGIRVANPDTGLPAGKGLAILVADLDEDGWPDLVVANDTVRNFLFRNIGGRFEEAGAESGLAFDNSGSATGAMGIDGARYANGEEFAVAIGNFANEMTSFYVAPDASLIFTDEANIAGIGPSSRGVLSFGVFFFDADLDGRQDLFQANGHVENDINIVQPSQHHAQSAQLFWNCGDGCRRPFAHLPPDLVGELAMPMVGRGAAYADVDNDGDLDVVVTQAGGRARLFLNEQTTGNHWLRFRLSAPAPNRDAIGARLRLHANGVIQERYVMPARSYLSQVELTQTFGLGAGAEKPWLEVAWPDGTVEMFSGFSPDQLVVLTKDSGAPVAQ
jgi:hypothetical protein